MHRVVFPNSSELSPRVDETTTSGLHHSDSHTLTTTMVHAFTDDIESPEPLRVRPRHELSTTPLAQSQAHTFVQPQQTQTQTQTTESATVPQNDSEPIALPFFRPNIIAVTAAPADEIGYLVGFESAPFWNWKSPLHHCCCQLYPTCLCSTFCPFMVIAQLNHKLKQKSFYSTLMYFIFGFSFLIVGAVMFRSPYILILVIIPIIHYAFQLRQFVRNQFRLPGSAQTDCVFSFCFPLCVLAQVSRHIYDYNSACEWRTLTVDGTKEGPPPTVSHTRAIMRGTRPPQDMATVRAAPRPELVYPVLQTPPRNDSRQSHSTVTTPPPVFVNISYHAQMTPSTSHFNTATNTQQHHAIPVGQTPCAVLSTT